MLPQFYRWGSSIYKRIKQHQIKRCFIGQKMSSWRSSEQCFSYLLMRKLDSDSSLSFFHRWCPLARCLLEPTFYWGKGGWQTVQNIFLNFYLFLKERERERQSMSGVGAEREGDTESEAGSRLWAVSTKPNAGLELTNHEIMTWAEVGRLTDWATQAPQKYEIFLKAW